MCDCGVLLPRMLGLSLSLKEICEKDGDGGDEWMASFVFLLFVANGASIHMCEYGEDSKAYSVFNICLLLLLFLRLLSLFFCLVLVLCRVPYTLVVHSKNTVPNMVF